MQTNEDEVLRDYLAWRETKMTETKGWSVQVLVPGHLKGKTAKGGRVPYEVLVFGTWDDYDCLEGPDGQHDEKVAKRYIVAKFGCYGDAMLWASQVAQRPVRPYRVIVRA